MFLQQYFQKELNFKLKQELNLKNMHMVPTISKICLNMGLGLDGKNKSILEECTRDMALISGQTPCITYTKKGIAGFNIRKDAPIGIKVTLRRARMYEFLERLIYIAIPRIRDFRGFSSRSFDKFGNYSIGIKQYTIFPEIDLDKVLNTRGMDISFNIKSRNREDSLKLLKSISFPIRD